MTVYCDERVEVWEVIMQGSGEVVLSVMVGDEIKW